MIAAGGRREPGGGELEEGCDGRRKQEEDEISFGKAVAGVPQRTPGNGVRGAGKYTYRGPSQCVLATVTKVLGVNHPDFIYLRWSYAVR
ncbi:hypothetical protein E2C01_094167 [Portunus trituberculatus]|uniref:Uncharacterized protein n=1 Tax=Portunus trituberculatus TaxID=210409 RepID=A0A5B7JW72_PORTR|nr:hypothetical protein [Portunus trituberculatus]